MTEPVVSSDTWDSVSFWSIALECEGLLRMIESDEVKNVSINKRENPKSISGYDVGIVLILEWGRRGLTSLYPVSKGTAT